MWPRKEDIKEKSVETHGGEEKGTERTEENGKRFIGNNWELQNVDPPRRWGGSGFLQLTES